MTTRRSIVLAGIAAMAGFAAEPWTKQPSEWTEKDVERILNRSPWAKQVSLEFNMQGMQGGPGAGGGPGGGGPGGGMAPGGGGMGPGGGGMGPAGGGMGPAGGGMAGPPGGAGMPELHAVVRWESALPIRLAMKKDEPQNAGSYTISVTGLPMIIGGAGAQRRAPLDAGGLLQQMKSATRLERKGKDPLYPNSIDRRGDAEDAAVVVVFSAESQPIERSDKEVTFVMRMGPLQVKAKFTLKEMMYDGKLEL